MNTESWGKYPKVAHRGVLAPRRPDDFAEAIRRADAAILPRGLGRSYGDSCLNEDGYLLSTEWLDKFQRFDPACGILRCEAGVTLDEILRVFVPRGWFLPVVPGTKFVTVGGAIANDIHGKNHHRAGSFGHQVLQFELLLSDGRRVVCSKEQQTHLFRATIGGLGLTGVILWAELALKPIYSGLIEVETIKFADIDEFATFSAELNKRYEYTVAWLDCASTGKALGRGIMLCGDHAKQDIENHGKGGQRSAKRQRIPVDAPSWLLNRCSVVAFNWLYYNRQRATHHKFFQHYEPYFFPLDRVEQWNRLYGKHGFLQWQCVLPRTGAIGALKAILREISRSGLGAFLAVLKEFGDLPAAGMLSFPMPGFTLALDFPNTGKPLLVLLEALDEIVVANGGRIYPAKDARMSQPTFLAGYPQVAEFERFVDPAFSSSLYRRLFGERKKNLHQSSLYAH